MKPLKPLTLLEEAFIAAYISNGGNGAAAVKTAGYKQDRAKGSAAVRAHRLLIRDNVSAEIAKRRAALREAAGVSAEEVIAGLAAESRGDLTDLMDARGSFDLKKIREAGLGWLIKKVKLRRVPGRRATKKTKAIAPYVFIESLELYSAHAARVQLCRVLGIEQEKGKNKNDLETRQRLLDERVFFGVEGFKRGGIELTRRDILELFVQMPESLGDLLPLVEAELAQTELASEKVQ